MHLSRTERNPEASEPLPKGDSEFGRNASDDVEKARAILICRAFISVVPYLYGQFYLQSGCLPFVSGYTRPLVGSVS